MFWYSTWQQSEVFVSLASNAGDGGVAVRDSRGVRVVRGRRGGGGCVRGGGLDGGRGGRCHVSPSRRRRGRGGGGGRGLVRRRDVDLLRQLTPAQAGSGSMPRLFIYLTGYYA